YSKPLGKASPDCPEPEPGDRAMELGFLVRGTTSRGRRPAMPNSPALSFSCQVRTAPLREKTFTAGSDAADPLMSARRWVEDQAREFLEQHSLPQNPWEAGSIFPAGVDPRSSEPLAELAVYTSDGDYVFEWDDQD